MGRQVQREPDKSDHSLAVSAYARTMLWFLLIVVLGVVAYRYRVKIMAKVLGQPESRIQRQIGRKKDY